MNKEVSPEQLEQLESGEPVVPPIRPRDLRRSIRVTIRGRSVRLAGSGAGCFCDDDEGVV